MRKKISLAPILQWLILLGFTFFTNTLVMAQKEQVIKGKVSDAGGPLTGATVTEKGGKNTAITNAAGVFEISVSNADARLIISFVGYTTQEIAVKGKGFINAVLESGKSGDLSTVVVTALGITRTKRSLGYDVGQINGEDMNRVAQTNALNAMAGKVSGVTVSSTGSSPTSTVSVVIRGTRSLNSDNQPLFVIDGVPVTNSLNNIGGASAGSGNDVDYGNVISDLNPNDIENVSILKGPSAAALYGSRAGNGVVLITTKSGKKSKGLGMTFSTTDEVSMPYHYFPNNLDYTVGTDPYTTPQEGVNAYNGVIIDLGGTNTYRFGTPLNQGINAIQWNSPLQADGTYKALPMVSHENLKNFVQKGFTTINSLSVENATDKDNYRFSYTNTLNNGIIPTTGVTRHNLALNVEHKVSAGFKLSTAINYTRSTSDNIVGGNDGVIKDVVYLSPSIDVRQMKDYWLAKGVQQRKALPPIGLDGSPGPSAWDPTSTDYDNNPWFILNQVKNGYLRNHLTGNIKASFNVSQHLNAFIRYSQDMFYENRETKMSYSGNSEPNGFYGLTNLYNSESNTDFLTTYHNKIASKFDLSASAGGNIRYVYGSNLATYSAPKKGIITPEVFNVSQIRQSDIVYNSGYNQKAVYSLYATASLGYNDMAYLDVTGRNDWSSTLPVGNGSYFYPSASLSLLLNKIIHFGDIVNLVKLRGGVASVGKDTNPYNLYSTVGTGNFGGITTQSTSSTLKNPFLKPEIATSSEIGLDLGFYKNRLRFEGTIYRSDNKNQVLGVNSAASTGFTSRQINAGLVRSEGIELQLGGTIISNKDWTWDVTVNYTKNNAYIMSLTNGVPYFSFWQSGPTGSWTYAKGQPIPNMMDSKGNQVISDGKLGQLWDNGLATVTDKSSPYYGYPLLDNGGFLQKDHGGDFQHKIVAGNFNPKLMMGVQTSVSYKSLTLSANVDMRLGGIFYSQTYRYMGSDAALRRQENVGIPIPAKYAGNTAAYLKSNPDAFIKISGLQQYHLVGGANTAMGGLPYTNNGITFNDGAFYPGVYQDGSGNYVENLGDLNVTGLDNYEDAVTNGPWSFGRMDMFDASYLKLRELTLSTQLPRKFVEGLKLQGISFGIYTRNVILWTKAKAGVDPELAFKYQSGPQQNGAQFSQGVEYYNINPWTIPMGVKLNVRF